MKNKKPKILIYDIETSLSIVASFSLYPNFISHKNIIQDPFIICASWKWLGDKKAKAIAVTKQEALTQNDKRVVQKLHEVIEEADIIIGHNGDKFDLKWVKGRGLKYGLTPLSYVKTIDTLKVARKNFRLMSNRLDYIGDYLGVGRKISTSEGLWLKVLQGKVSAIKEMVKYNKQDVYLLEDVYLKLRPYIDNHPDLNMMLKGHNQCCKACGSIHSQKYGIRYAKARKYQKFLCKSCGHVFTNNKSI